jgi:hypothetical protein
VQTFVFQVGLFAFHLRLPDRSCAVLLCLMNVASRTSEDSSGWGNFRAKMWGMAFCG